MAGLYGPEGTTVPVLDIEDAELESPSSSGIVVRDDEAEVGPSSKSGGSGGKEASFCLANARERSDMAFPTSRLCERILFGPSSSRL